MPDAILTYLPPFYQEIKDFVELSVSEDLELERLLQAVQLLHDDQFVETASTSAIERREAMLGIQASSEETLDFRRLRILNRYQIKPPFTVRYLQERLDYIAGRGKATVSLEPGLYRLSVTTAIQDAPVFGEVERTVMMLKPANLEYRQQTALVDKIHLREQITSHKLSRNTKLGTSWKAGITPFAEPGTGVAAV
ncbi:putative phage tail protein [Paenibacillus kobensis]|uniref:putative phage tail protein n=1 Tax=Paenibacillus kobensis TaxID=59841 RepID=UPI000FD9E2DA|nr:putative phage tail protein [Paenibacillus kobensis]